MDVAEARRVLQEKLVESRRVLQKVVEVRGAREKWSHYFYYIF
jgi:hypothetical protein